MSHTSRGTRGGGGRGVINTTAVPLQIRAALLQKPSGGSGSSSGKESHIPEEEAPVGG